MARKGGQKIEQEEILNAEVKGILVRTESGENVLIELSQEAQEVLFK